VQGNKIVTRILQILVCLTMYEFSSRPVFRSAHLAHDILRHWNHRI